MLQWNELRVTADAKNLIIDVQVQDMEYYDKIVIDKIVVDTQKTYVETGPSSNPLFEVDGCNKKHLRVALDIDSIGDNLFFVYAFAKGDPNCNTPCGMKNTMICGVAFNKYPFYANAMNFLGELDTCEPPQELIDYILKTKAFEVCLSAGNYTKAIQYWNWFKNYKTVYTKKCGCHGKY